MPFKDLEKQQEYNRKYRKEYYMKNREQLNTNHRKWYASTRGKKWKKKYYSREDIIIKNRGKSTKWNQELKHWAIEKLGRKCMGCGRVFDNCVYDFHHSKGNGKIWNEKTSIRMSMICQWKKIGEIPDDIILLCANCHRIEHHKESLV